MNRYDEYNLILKSIPGKNADKLRTVAGLLECTELTARKWQTPKCNRPIPEYKIKLLRKLLVV